MQQIKAETEKDNSLDFLKEAIIKGLPEYKGDFSLAKREYWNCCYKL